MNIQNVALVLLTTATVIIITILIVFIARVIRLERNLAVVMTTMALASPAMARRMEEQGTQVVVNGGDQWDDEYEWNESDDTF